MQLKLERFYKALVKTEPNPGNGKTCLANIRVSEKLF